MTTESRPIAITMGDPAGIGPEIVAKGLAENPRSEALRPLVVGDAAVLEGVVSGCSLGLELRAVDSPDEVEGRPKTVEVLDLANVRGHRFGVADGTFGRAAVEYVETACRFAREGSVDGLVTAPINKEAIRAGGSRFPGHTEMLATLFDVSPQRVLTLFVLDRLRIFFVTRHHSLLDAIELITIDSVVRALVRATELSPQIGILRPRLVLAALNPHAGESGMLGGEEGAILEPAIREARALGVDVVGPVPADAVFHQCREGRYDAVLCLYHDQGHIAAKTAGFFSTVSCTLGLPVIRTSVDHGTAFDIAGKWVADPTGQIAAMKLASELAPRVVNRR